jgi:hypothetical protein
MMPPLNSLLTYRFVKTAMEDTDPSDNTSNPDMVNINEGRFKRMLPPFLQNVGAGALGYGAGRGISTLAGLALRPLFKDQLTPEKLQVISNVAGLLASAGGMAMLQSYNEGQRRVNAARDGKPIDQIPRPAPSPGDARER